MALQNIRYQTDEWVRRVQQCVAAGLHRDRCVCGQREVEPQRIDCVRPAVVRWQYNGVKQGRAGGVVDRHVRLQITANSSKVVGHIGCDCRHVTGVNAGKRLLEAI